MKPRIDLIIGPEQDYYHSSAIYAGLDTLARRGVIALRFRRPKAHERDLADDAAIVGLSIRGPAGARPVLIAIDLRDQSHVFTSKALRDCDIYLKRSHYQPDITALPAEWASKVRPFGLNFACRTFGSTVRLLLAEALRFLRPRLERMKRLRDYLVLPRVAEFEQGPDDPIEPTVVFQTRVWLPEDADPGESEIINEGRVAVIRALRAAFGDRFRGGLVPTPLALERYPREVSPFPSRRRLYTAMSKKNLIGIYTIGLHHSVAFKMSEYLAAAQCIVSEPVRNELPTPLIAGKHFLSFQNADECVAACQRLFSDRDFAVQMRRANHEYYTSEVSPAGHLRRLLERHGGLGT